MNKHDPAIFFPKIQNWPFADQKTEILAKMTFFELFIIFLNLESNVWPKMSAILYFFNTRRDLSLPIFILALFGKKAFLSYQLVI